MGPYQALSELGFRLQREHWLAAQPQPVLGCVVVFAATSLLVLLAWGPLAAGRGGGTTSLLALDRATQLRRLPLMLLTHLDGPSVARALAKAEAPNALRAIKEEV